MTAVRFTTVAALLLLGFCSKSNAAARATDEAKPVTVTLYGESLCPYCEHAVVATLAPLFKDGINSIFNFTYVAYGNALNTSEGPVCQHGAEECLFNRVINCAQHLNPGQDKWFPYVSCLEGGLQGDFHQDEAVAKQCAEDADMDYNALKDCANGKLGDELDAKAQAATDALQPAHAYVPWVVVNGVPLGASYEALKSVVCAAYAGVRPEACYAVPPTVQSASFRSEGSRPRSSIRIA